MPSTSMMKGAGRSDGGAVCVFNGLLPSLVGNGLARAGNPDARPYTRPYRVRPPRSKNVRIRCIVLQAGRNWTPVDLNSPVAVAWGSRGRRFKSCQPDRRTAGQRPFSIPEGGLAPFQATIAHLFRTPLLATDGVVVSRTTTDGSVDGPSREVMFRVARGLDQRPDP